MKQFWLALPEILNPPMENYVTPPRTEKVICPLFDEALSFDEERPSQRYFTKILGWKRVGKTNKNHYNGDMARIVDEAIIIGESITTIGRMSVVYDCIFPFRRRIW